MTKEKIRIKVKVEVKAEDSNGSIRPDRMPDRIVGGRA